MTERKVEDLKALIADDNRQMRLLIRNMLLQLGVADVAEASGGKQALELIHTFKPNLILCGLEMKSMGGLEFVRKLRREADNPARLAAVIMITAYTDLKHVAKARDAGVTEFMAKPISAAELGKRIKRILEEPRPFVEAPDFAGPDRRRQKTAAYGGAERRKTPPVYLDPSDADTPDTDS